jgi:hypothetical protein
MDTNPVPKWGMTGQAGYVWRGAKVALLAKHVADLWLDRATDRAKAEAAYADFVRSLEGLGGTNHEIIFALARAALKLAGAWCDRYRADGPCVKVVKRGSNPYPALIMEWYGEDWEIYHSLYVGGNKVYLEWYADCESPFTETPAFAAKWAAGNGAVVHGLKNDWAPLLAKAGVKIDASEYGEKTPYTESPLGARMARQEFYDYTRRLVENRRVYPEPDPVTEPDYEEFAWDPDEVPAE